MNGLFCAAATNVLSMPVGAYSGCVTVFVVFNTFLREANVTSFFVGVSGSIINNFSNKPTGITMITDTLRNVISNSSITGAINSNSIAVPLVGGANCGPRFTTTTRTSTSANKRVVPPVVNTTTFLVTRGVNVPCDGVTLHTVLPTILCFVNMFVTIRLRTGGRKLHNLAGRRLPHFVPLLGRSCLLLPLVVLVNLMDTGLGSVTFTTTVTVLTAVIMNLFGGRGHVAPVHVFRTLTTNKHNVVAITITYNITNVVTNAVAVANLTDVLVGTVVALTGNRVVVTLFLAVLYYVILNVNIPAATGCYVVTTAYTPVLARVNIPTVTTRFFIFCFNVITSLAPPITLTTCTNTTVTRTGPVGATLASAGLTVNTFVMPCIFTLGPTVLFISANIFRMVLVYVASIINVFNMSSTLRKCVLAGVG